MFLAWAYDILATLSSVLRRSPAKGATLAGVGARSRRGRPWRRGCGIVAASLLLSVTSAAQGTVRGVVTVLERGGARTTDLNDAVLWLEPLDGAARAGSPTSATIVMSERKYTPRVRMVSVGSTVDFPNQDPFRHNVFSKSGPSEFDLGLYERSETRRARLAAAGIYPIFCNIHARMVAFVVAVPSMWATQADDGGRFSIAEVPAGRYRLRLWHDRGGELTREVTVLATGVSEFALTLDARAYRYVQHRNKFGKPYPPDGGDRY